MTVRPTITVLDQAEVDCIIDAALSILERVGILIGSRRILNVVGAWDGASVVGDRVTMSRHLVETCLKSAPETVRIYGQDDDEPLVLAGDAVHFTACSTAPYIYDGASQGLRQPLAKDMVNHAKVMNHCANIDLQSGSFVISDVASAITGAYRYYLALLYCPKPIFGGAIRTDDLPVIKDMLATMVGGEAALEDRPLAVICVNPTSPLGLSDIVAENIFVCATYGLPAMLTPIPLAGGSSPVTLAGTLTQHTAENLGALVAGQCVRAGAPAIFGGGPSIMEMQKGTACQASSEAVIMGAAIGQIAKRLGLPSATNIGRADSKCVDYQAGQESGVGLTSMALAGINLIRGAGMMEYGNVVSTEKLLIDNDICGMAKRLVRPIDTSRDALAVDVIVDKGTTTEGFIAASHTLKWYRSEIHRPSDVIDRGHRREFEEQGCKDAFGRAADRIKGFLKEYTPRDLDKDKKKEIDRIMATFAKKYGMDNLPITEIA